MATLVVDTGQDIVEIFSVQSRCFAFYRGRSIARAIRRLQSAHEIITYRGKNYDLQELAKFAGLSGDLPPKGVHSDMRNICWSDRIWGRDLVSTYKMHFGDCPPFPDTHEGSVQRDCYMTFKLWQLWKRDQLKITDGNPA
jgi:hypothetical protein